MRDTTHDEAKLEALLRATEVLQQACGRRSSRSAASKLGAIRGLLNRNSSIKRSQRIQTAAFVVGKGEEQELGAHPSEGVLVD